MMEPGNKNPWSGGPTITPQLALRVAVFGAIALGLFAIIFFRLWYLQVLSGDEYLAEANQNRVRELRIQAPRGEIVDRNGDSLVKNRRAVVVQLDPSEIPDDERTLAAEWGQKMTARAKRPKGSRGEPEPIPEVPSDELLTLFKRLGRVLDLTPDEIQSSVIRSLTVVPFGAVRIKADAAQASVVYIAERPEQFPGVEVEEQFLRSYPKEELAAQILGTVGQINPDQLEEERFRGVKQGTIVGQSGLEFIYDRYLRGTDGSRRVQVDAFGRPIATTALRKREPKSGEQLKLSIDLDVQETAQKAMSNPQLNPNDFPGAFVAMDPRNGQIIAMGSNPEFDPNVLAKPITEEAFEQRFGEDADSPLVNRAMQSNYSTGSTFKPFTALAGLQSGAITPETAISDTGCAMIYDRERCNAGDTAYGTVDLRRSLEVSSDIYYYRLAQKLFEREGDPLQKWARRFGFGRRTGIDLPNEFRGFVPDQKSIAKVVAEEKACRKRNPELSACFRIDTRQFQGGDLVNLAIGQGDFQATPLQLAVAYAAIENGGRVVRPHLGLEIENGRGELIQRIERAAARKIDLEPEALRAVRDGLRAAAQGDEGTSTDVFEGWPHDKYPVYGKTGTVERDGQNDQSWYVAYVDAPKRPLVVVATVEKGGFGAEVAAPMARLIMSQYYNVQKVLKKGESQDA